MGTIRELEKRKSALLKQVQKMQSKCSPLLKSLSYARKRIDKIQEEIDRNKLKAFPILSQMTEKDWNWILIGDNPSKAHYQKQEELFRGLGFYRKGYDLDTGQLRLTVVVKKNAPVRDLLLIEGNILMVLPHLKARKDGLIYFDVMDSLSDYDTIMLVCDREAHKWSVTNSSTYKKSISNVSLIVALEFLSHNYYYDYGA